MSEKHNHVNKLYRCEATYLTQQPFHTDVCGHSYETAGLDSSLQCTSIHFTANYMTRLPLILQIISLTVCMHTLLVSGLVCSSMCSFCSLFGPKENEHVVGPRDTF